MRATREHLDGLARLHKIREVDERRSLFRQAMATLAHEASSLRPVPLEGLDPVALRESVKVALGGGFVDDLEGLDPAHAAAAIYELAGALPAGEEKRELGRRVLRALHDGNAATFTMVATQLALGSRRGLSGTAIRARVALALDLPIGSGIAADPLALALIARRDLADEWLITPSTGSLPSRRLAARLLERAAREAARRASAGDEGPLSVFLRPEVEAAAHRLLSDREPLVWRHVATARGLLAQAIPRFSVEIEEALSPHLSPTEWRRAAASLASTIALDPERARQRCSEVLGSDLLARDIGIASAMILGLARAAEAQPEAADELLNALVRTGSIDAIEALIEVRNERVGGDLGEWAARLALARLREDELAETGGDDGKAALLIALEADLRGPEERGDSGPVRTPGALPQDPTLRERLDQAKAAFVEKDARSAQGKAYEALESAIETLTRLQLSRDHSREARIQSFLLMRELDIGLLESSTLVDLFHLGARSDEKGSSTFSRALDDLMSRFHTFLVEREREPVKDSAAMEHPTLRIRRMRTLLHLVDADGNHLEERTPELRDRRLLVTRFLLSRAREDAPSPARRIVAASLARTFDALLREEIADLSDVLIVSAEAARTEHDLVTIGEASMVQEAATAFRAYATLVERTERSARVTETRAISGLDALRELVRYLPSAGSPRVDALRQALAAFADVLDQISEAGSLVELGGGHDGATESFLGELAEVAGTLARLVAGARRRIGTRATVEAPSCASALRALDVSLLHAVRAGGDASTVRHGEAGFDLGALADSIAEAIEALREDLPPHLAEVASNVLARVVTLPSDAPRRSKPPPMPKRKAAALPPWMPPSRTLGGFYVVRALGSGAAGSVFVARRSEERANDKAEQFALKVPEYAGSAARTLSEAQFLQIFRDEAGALLAVPQHENLAKLVTFDVGAKPKPILVMELVEGPTLERLVETGALDMERALRVLDGVARGLQVMHDQDVGHLDLKPSNVILRDPDGPGPALETAVLVDFGLAGRTLRPGCATSSYGAPEIWGLVPKGYSPKPMAADVYAYGCLAYEALTGQTLFSGASEVAIITSHLQHDGDLPALDAFVALDRRLAPLTEALRWALRQDPRMRRSIAEVRQAIQQCSPLLFALRWPLPAPALAA